MVYEEAPVVECYTRNISFSKIQWLSKTEFLNRFQNEIQLGEAKFFIGKNELNAYNGSNKSCLAGYVDLNDLKLKTAIEKQVFTYDDYHVLHIPDAESYQWIPTVSDRIPKYALRACLDHGSYEFFYIGRTVDRRIGNVCRSDKLLYVYDSQTNRPKSYDNYEILCLKPTPANLKQLCRAQIRLVVNQSNGRIAQLCTQLPRALIDYLKYPSYLTIGDCLLKSDKLISQDGTHELMLTQNNKLVHLSLNTNKTHVLYDFVESIWIFPSYGIINRYDNAFVYFLFVYNDSDEIASDGNCVKLELTNNSQLVLRLGDTEFKKYSI